MTDTHTHDIAKAKAEASFKRKEQQARDGAIAMSEYLAAQKATQAKTERLRALRLAKEAQESTNAPAEATTDASAGTKKKKPAARRGS